MRRKRKRGRTLGSFGDLAHVARIYIGGKTPAGGRIPKRALTRLEGRVAAIAGGMTMFRARGIYRSAAQPFVNEPSVVIETFVSDRSCAVFKRQLRDVAQKAAKEGLQESVGVVVQCAGEPTDATFATMKRRKKH